MCVPHTHIHAHTRTLNTLFAYFPNRMHACICEKSTVPAAAANNRTTSYLYRWSRFHIATTTTLMLSFLSYSFVSISERASEWVSECVRHCILHWRSNGKRTLTTGIFSRSLTYTHICAHTHTELHTHTRAHTVNFINVSATERVTTITYTHILSSLWMM